MSFSESVLRIGEESRRSSESPFIILPDGDIEINWID
jgi:hypothetical protein